jgi:hypothetical protein
MSGAGMLYSSSEWAFRGLVGFTEAGFGTECGERRRLS